MPERTFFTLRYALPGYTFILVTLLVAYPKLRMLSVPNHNVELIGAFLAFFTLLSGVAIGFLVSQFWYVAHNSFLLRCFLPETRKLVEDEFGLVKDPKRQMVFLDHIHHLQDPETVTYTQRRFDLFHTLASSLFAIFFGLLCGVLVRIDFFRTDITLGQTINWLGRVNVQLDILGVSRYDLIVIVIIALLSIALFVGFRFVEKTHSRMIYVSVRKALGSGKFTHKDAKAVFPEDYFTQKGDESKTKE
jgi:hypothetical protein